MQEALPYVVVLVVFVGTVIVLSRRRPGRKPRNRYARWNALNPPRRTTRTRRAEAGRKH